MPELIKQTKNSDGEKSLDAYNKIANYYIGYKPDSTIYYCKEALKLTNNNEERAVFITSMGLANNYKGEFRIALGFQLQAVELMKNSKDNDRLAYIYHNTGIAYDYMGDYDKALDFYFKSLSLRKSQNDLSGCQSSFGNIGLIYYLKGDFNNAIKFMFASKEIATFLNDQMGIASAQTNIGLVYQAQEEFSKELNIHLEAQKVYEKIGTQQDIALGYNNIGSALMDLKEYDKAIGYHQKSLSLKKEIGDIVGITMSMQNLGNCYYKIDSLEAAEKISLEGFVNAEKQDDIPNRIELANTLTMIYLKKNNLRNAEKYLMEGLNSTRAYDYVRIEKIYKTASQFYEKKGDYKTALIYQTTYFDLLDSIEDYENKDLILKKELEAKFKETEHKKELQQLQKDEEAKLKRETEKQRQQYLNIIMITGIAGLLIFIFFVLKNYREKKKANAVLTERNSVISRQHAEISSQKQLIEEKNKDITDSIQYAKRLQDAILPEAGKFNAVFPDYFILYKPKDIVSGDFYWMEKIPLTGNREIVLFAVVDCTGHGVPGGFVSIVAHNALNRAVKEFKLTAPALILDKISELVEESFRQNENKDIRDGMDISLCCFMFDILGSMLEDKQHKTNNIKLKTVSWSGANNPLWVVRDKNIIEYKADKQPIGLFEDRKPFTQHQIELKKGDSIYLFSDGYADQFGGPAGKKFKYSQLKEIIINSTGVPMPEQKTIFESSFEKWRNWPDKNGNENELEQIDDVCVIGVRI